MVYVIRLGDTSQLELKAVQNVSLRSQVASVSSSVMLQHTKKVQFNKSVVFTSSHVFCQLGRNLKNAFAQNPRLEFAGPRHSNASSTCSAVKVRHSF